MAISTFKRYEKKYMITKNQLDSIMPALLEHMELDPFCIGGNEYRIYSIYYDTDNHDVIRQNSSKPVYKEKMRIRSYYDRKDPDDKVFMELKKKSEGIGNKRRIKIKIKEIEPFVNDGVMPETKDYLSTQVAREIAYFLSNNKVHPALYVQYDRLALFGKEDKNFRMTFDRNLRTRRSNFVLGESDEDEFLLPEDTYIMEIKILGAMPLWLTHILSENNLFSHGFSKYGSRYKKEAAAHELIYHLEDEYGNEVDFDYFSDK
ncbi:MAG: polyphosphate polymerase domain-containing protein [Eubacterium sp.]|nr:polyphosphate polymerase domain-containing protein [Eubacterium sp.]MBR2278907.1 polyphosphate polymerase domain-containing protein [Eubacterium sp.]